MSGSATARDWDALLDRADDPATEDVLRALALVERYERVVDAVWRLLVTTMRTMIYLFALATICLLGATVQSLCRRY